MNLQERIKKLVNLAEALGYITYDKINKVLPDASPEQMDQIVVSLRTRDIEILEYAPIQN